LSVAIADSRPTFTVHNPLSVLVLVEQLCYRIGILNFLLDSTTFSKGEENSAHQYNHNNKQNSQRKKSE
jgi:hypothetical protein